MKNESLWLDTVKLKKGITINEDIETDILIVGGGITGLTTAYFLKDSGLNVTLIDSGKIGNSVTSRSTGKLTYLHNNVYNDIEKKYGPHFTDLYLKAQKDAIEIVKDIILTNGIKCNFESNSSHLFTSKNSEISKIKKIEKILARNKILFKNTDNIGIKFSCSYSIKVDNTAVFNPAKYLLDIKDICINNGIKVYEGIKAIDCIKQEDGYLIYTNKQHIFTKKLVIACHYPFFINPGFIPLKTYLEKSYLTAAKIEKNKKFNAINMEKDVHSIRYYSDKEDYVIYLSESRRLGDNMDNVKNYDNVIWKMKSLLSQDITHMWFNYDLMTIDSLPLIGYLEKDNYNLLIGTGYNTWGMTNGTIAGKIISDLLTDKVNEYVQLFEPTRPIMLSSVGTLVTNGVQTGKTFIGSKLFKKKDFYKVNVKIIEKDNKKYGVYIDEEGKEYTVLNTCPHMMCSLVFNEVDKTWDCPCHGSRFDIKGNSVKGPAVYSIKLPKKLI